MNDSHRRNFEPFITEPAKYRRTVGHYRRSEEKTSQQRPIAGHAGNPMSDGSTQYVLTIDAINLTQPNWDSCLLLNEHAVIKFTFLSVFI